MLNPLVPGHVVVLAAAAILSASSGVAQAEPALRKAAVVPAMRLGASAAPPVGFLDLCSRAPNLCVSSDVGAVELEALRVASMQRYWADAFAQRRTAPAAVAAPEARVDWSRVFADARRQGRASRPVVSARSPASPVVVAVGVGTTSRVPITLSPEPMAAGDAGVPMVETDAEATVEWAAAAAGEAISSYKPRVEVEVLEAEAVSDPVFALDRAGWRLVNGINRSVNRSIRQTADSRLYGVEDFWTLPSGGRGDCEDFVLAKRQDLIAAGVPVETLSIAIVETQWGESHAVLLLATDQGEYVLDSLSPWVTRWDRVNYVFKERQLPGRPFDWVTAET